jgi:hypothetical protein
MLSMLLHQIALIKKDTEAIQALQIERHEAGLVYMYNMMKVAKHAVRSHGDNSAVANAVKARVYEEATILKGLDPRSVLALMEQKQMQEACRMLQSKLRMWARVTAQF